jgi:hypothetical protein
MRPRFWKEGRDEPPAKRTRTHGDFRGEPFALAALIAASYEGNGDSFKAFVRYRFRRPLHYSVKSSLWYGVSFSVLSLLAIGGGLASSALATVPGNHDLAIAIIGIVIAVATAVNRLWRPGLRSAVRHRTANSLRREGWAFLCGQGSYAKGDPTQRADAFIVAVERINAEAEAIDEAPVAEESS